MIDEEHAVEVIHLMLDAGRQQPVGLQHADLILLVEIADLDLRRPRHVGIMFGQGQAAFAEGHDLVRLPDEFRVDQLVRLGRVAVAGAVDDDDAQGLADLRRGETDSRGEIHRFEHIVHQAAQRRVHGRDRTSLHLEARVGSGEDVEKGHENDAFAGGNGPVRRQ